MAGLRLSLRSLQSLDLMFLFRSCWQGWGPQSTPSEASHRDSYLGFSLPIAASGKSGFLQARLPR